VVNDALILEATAEVLRAKGAEVHVLTRTWSGSKPTPGWHRLSRSRATSVAKLAEIERERDLVVINSRGR